MNKGLPEVKAEDTVEETDMEDLLIEIPGRRVVLLGTKNVPNAAKRAIFKNVARANRVKTKSLLRVTI